MRGKLKNWEKLIFRLRITPAYAGKTEAERENIESYKDHPRVCGENNNTLIVSKLYERSPPRMRGKQIDRIGICRYPRITPAYAGKTCRILNSAAT